MHCSCRVTPSRRRARCPSPRRPMTRPPRVAARLGRDLPEVLEPVLAPSASVGGIDRDHRHTVVRRHLDEPVPKLPVGSPATRRRKPLARLPREDGARSLPALLAPGDEVEVLDHDRPGAMCARKASTQEMACRFGRPCRCLKPVSSSGTLTGAPIGFPEGRDTDGEVPVVQVDCDHGARAQVLHVRARLAVGERPRGVEIPACLPGRRRRRSARAALGLCRHLLTAVGEDDRARSRYRPPDDWRGARGFGRRSSSQCSSGCQRTVRLPRS